MSYPCLNLSYANAYVVFWVLGAGAAGNPEIQTRPRILLTRNIQCDQFGSHVRSKRRQDGLILDKHEIYVKHMKGRKARSRTFSVVQPSRPSGEHIRSHSVNHASWLLRLSCRDTQNRNMRTFTVAMPTGIQCPDLGHTQDLPLVGLNHIGAQTTGANYFASQPCSSRAGDDARRVRLDMI